jgi:TPR repeat protein
VPETAKLETLTAPAVPLTPSIIASLLLRANEKLDVGDILSARLCFERAAAAGSEEGAMGAGKTYDPEYLAAVDATGPQADIKHAIDWYRIASTTHGNREAQKRIDALTRAAAR